MAVGRDTYTPELAAEICRRLAEGESLRAVCRTEGYPNFRTVLDWVDADIFDFAAQYTRARQIGYTLLAEELVEIADDARNDWMVRNAPDNAGYEVNGEHVQRSRLRLDTRKWILSKMLPKIYGDKTALEHSGAIKVQKQLSNEEALAEIAELSQELGLKYQLVEASDDDA